MKKVNLLEKLHAYINLKDYNFNIVFEGRLIKNVKPCSYEVSYSSKLLKICFECWENEEISESYVVYRNVCEYNLTNIQEKEKDITIFLSVEL